MDAAPPVVEAHGLGWHEPAGRPILEEVSLTVQTGERLAVIGPNGAGKSTLLRILAGRIAPACGTVRIAGRPLAAMDGATRARTVACVAQDEPIDGRFVVRDYVALGRLPHRRTASLREHGEAIEAALRTCRIDTLATRRTASLSGGERQKMRIARALAQAPMLLLLDEPTNHLDLSTRIELLELIASLRIATVTVVHDLALLPRCADRVLVLDRGRVTASGRTDRVLEADLVRRVFELDVVHAIHPATGDRVLAFDRRAA